MVIGAAKVGAIQQPVSPHHFGDTTAQARRVNVEVEVEVLQVIHQRPLVARIRCHGPVQFAEAPQLEHRHTAGVGDVGFQGREHIQRAAANQVPEKQRFIDAVTDDGGGFELVVRVFFAPVNRLVEAMHHDRHIQLRELFPHREQAFIERFQTIEVGPAHAHTLGPQLSHRAFNFLRRVLRVREVGVAPEIEVIGIGATECRQLVVADARVLVGEVTRPIHETVGRRGHHQLVDTPLGHQLAPTGVAHAREDVGLRFGVRRGFGRLLGTEGKMPDGQPLHLHERAPEFVTVQHALSQQVGVDINQHGILLVVISQQTQRPTGRTSGSICGKNTSRTI